MISAIVVSYSRAGFKYIPTKSREDGLILSRSTDKPSEVNNSVLIC